MNAYKLADLIGLCGDGGYNQDAANMLRQQADRIAELEKLLEHSVGSDCREMRYIQEIENKDARIAELEKQGEPVAWMEYIQDEEWEVWYTEPTDLPEGHSYKPLYLAPQSKPLNDEEIYALWCEADNTELLPEMRLNDGSINYIITTFAKLIEERHGIK